MRLNQQTVILDRIMSKGSLNYLAASLLVLFQTSIALAVTNQETSVTAPVVPPPVAGTTTNRGISAEIQWRPGIDSNHRPLMEIYLHNRSDRRLEWAKVLLNGSDVAASTNVGWFQFYPVDIAQPGETTELQISLVRPPETPQTVRVDTKTGEQIEVEFPPMEFPPARILAVTWSLDFRRMHVAFSMLDEDIRHSRSVTKAVVNGKDCTPMIRYAQEACWEVPGFVVIDLPEPATQGQAVHLRLEFANQIQAQAMFRAWKGIFIDDFGVTEKDAKRRKELGLDLVVPTRALPGDPCCEDLRARRIGHSAQRLIERRLKWYREGDCRLAYPYLCTSASGNIDYSLYGQIADALQLNPYRLGWGAEDRFPEPEENRLAAGSRAAGPKPTYWIPEAFTYGDRMLEPDEARLMLYGILGVGIKGVRWFIFKGFADLKGYDQSPPLLDGIKKLNGEIKRLEPYLAPAIAMTKQTYNSGGAVIPEYDSGRPSPDKCYRVYALWNGLDGVCVLVRTLNYTTDREANALGLKPRFRFEKQKNVRCRIDRPGWLNVNTNAQVIDLLSEQSFQAQCSEGEIEWRLPELEIACALWIPNASPSKPNP